MEGCGGLWRVVEGCGGLWRVVEGCGGLWRVVEGCGGLWRVVEGCGGSLWRTAGAGECERLQTVYARGWGLLRVVMCFLPDQVWYVLKVVEGDCYWLWGC